MYNTAWCSIADSRRCLYFTPWKSPKLYKNAISNFWEFEFCNFENLNWTLSFGYGFWEIQCFLAICKFWRNANICDENCVVFTRLFLHWWSQKATNKCRFFRRFTLIPAENSTETCSKIKFNILQWYHIIRKLQIPFEIVNFHIKIFDFCASAALTELRGVARSQQTKSQNTKKYALLSQKSGNLKKSWTSLNLDESN